MDEFLSRLRELESTGLDHSHAFGLANLEDRIANWPSKWGNNLEVLIYGDFKGPERTLEFEALGITVHPENLENTVIKNARCVLKATVQIAAKDVSSLLHAIRRLNTLIGNWTLVTWGNTPCRWWSYVTHGTASSGISELDHKDLNRALNSYFRLPVTIQKKIDAALYWVREPKNMLLEFPRTDTLRVYAAYWNAFECLVDAITTLFPREKLTKPQKQERIDRYLADLNKNPTASDIEKLYKEIVNPGFKALASHALTTCFKDKASYYIGQCFNLQPISERLYQIRNAINHGEVDSEDIKELIRIEARLSVLWIMVWGMFGRIIEFPAPVDTNAS